MNLRLQSKYSTVFSLAETPASPLGTAASPSSASDPPPSPLAFTPQPTCSHTFIPSVLHLLLIAASQHLTPLLSPHRAQIRRDSLSHGFLPLLHSVQSRLAKLRFVWRSSGPLRTPLIVIPPEALSSFPKSLIRSHFFFYKLLNVKEADWLPKTP